MKKIHVILFVLLFFAIGLPVKAVTTTTTTTAPVCTSYYWFDNTTKNCDSKQFCGAFMYLGLKTFTTKTACLTEVNKGLVYIPMAGDLIKTTKSSAIYIVDDNLKRHLFSNEATFWTWYTGGWSKQYIRTISVDDFEMLEPGKNVIARAGANLIQFDNGNKLYAVTPGGVLCEVRALYGTNLPARTIKIQSSFETDYIRDNACIIISSSKLPDGTLLQYLNDTKIYYIEDGKKRLVTTEGFAANTFLQSSIVKNVPVAMTYTAGKNITAAEYNIGILYNLNYTRSAEIGARPDLIITDISFPASRIIVNQPITVTMTIKNIGGNLTSELGLRNLVFNGQDWSASNISHADYPTAARPLQTGQTFTVTYTGKFVAAGTKNFSAKVNEPSEIVELNSVNNSFSKTATVYAQ